MWQDESEAEAADLDSFETDRDAAIVAMELEADAKIEEPPSRRGDRNRRRRREERPSIETPPTERSGEAREFKKIEAELTDIQDLIVSRDGTTMARSDLVTPSSEDTNKAESNNSQLDLTWVLFSVALTLILITWAITVCICCYIR